VTGDCERLAFLYYWPYWFALLAVLSGACAAFCSGSDGLTAVSSKRCARCAASSTFPNCMCRLHVPAASMFTPGALALCGATDHSTLLYCML